MHWFIGSFRSDTSLKRQVLPQGVVPSLKKKKQVNSLRRLCVLCVLAVFCWRSITRNFAGPDQPQKHKAPVVCHGPSRPIFQDLINCNNTKPRRRRGRRGGAESRTSTWLLGRRRFLRFRRFRFYHRFLTVAIYISSSKLFQNVRHIQAQSLELLQ